MKAFLLNLVFLISFNRLNAFLPTLRYYIQREYLLEIKNQLIPSLEQHLQNQRLPDITHQKDIALITHYLNYTQLKLHNLTLLEDFCEIEFANDKISLKIEDIGADISGNLQVNSRMMNVDGRILIKAKNIQINLVLSPVLTLDNKIQFLIDQHDVFFEDFDFQMEGDFGVQVLNVFLNVAKTIIRWKIEKRFKMIIENKVLNKLNQNLKEIQNSNEYEINGIKFPLQFKTLSPIKILKDKIQIDQQIFVYDRKKGIKPMSEPQTLPFKQYSDGVQLFIGEHFFKNSLEIAQENRLFKFTITKEDAVNFIQLTTKNFENIWKDIVNTYGNTDIVLEINSNSNPEFKILENKILGSIDISCIVKSSEDGFNTRVLELKAKLKGQFKPSFEKGVVNVILQYLIHENIKVVNTQLKSDYDQNNLNKIISKVLKDLIPIIQKRYFPGLQISQQIVQKAFKNFEIKTINGAIIIINSPQIDTKFNFQLVDFQGQSVDELTQEEEKSEL